MIRFEILLNGKSLCEVGVAEDDQFEAALVKVLGSDQPVLNITVFDPSNPKKKEFVSWDSRLLKINDELVIKLCAHENEDSFVTGLEEESADEDNETALTCSFCRKTSHEVETLISGSGAYICDECVDLCREIIESEKT